jgi:hypothetical protein
MTARNTKLARAGAVLGALLVIGSAVATIWFIPHATIKKALAKFVPPPAHVVTYSLSQAGDSAEPALVAAIKAQNYTAQKAADPTRANIVISSQPIAGGQVFTTRQVGKPNQLATSSGAIVSATDEPTLYVKTTASAAAPAATLTTVTAALKTALTAAPATWSLTAIGDIIIGRTVYTRMQHYGDMLHPFALMKNQIAAADLTTADLECSFSDTNPIITNDGMSFVSPFAAAAGLSDSGIDAVSMANNHSYNGGAEGFLNTLSYLTEHKIGSFGGGRNSTEAHTPFITTVKGTKVALLAYNSIVGGQPAGATTPGMADIRAAKSQAALVFVYFHWSAEYTHSANDDMRAVAHAAIDAGADLILGSHPHWVQGIEWYKDHLITYSLGNFIFDQEQSTETKQGTLLNATFAGSQLVSASFSPYQIEDYNQPHPADAATAQKILGDIYGHSWWAQ